jgi:PAS domain S-box-containing protein
VTPTPDNSSAPASRRDADVRTSLIGFAVVTALLIVMASLVVRFYTRGLERSAGENMAAIARAQGSLIENLLNERLGDGRLLAVRPTVWGSLDPANAISPMATAQLGMARAIEQTRETFGYKLIVVVDSSLKVRYPRTYLPGPDDREFLTAVMRARTARILPFRVDAGGSLELGVGYPVYAGGDSTRSVVGAALLVRDATIGLLPLLAQVVGERGGVESALYQLEGDSISVVAATTTGTTLTPMHIRLGRYDRTRVAAKLYASRVDSAVTGLDYRTVPVIAAGVRIAGTSWLVTAKVERSSLNERARTFTIFAWLTAVVLILFAGLILRVLRLAAERRSEQRQFALATRFLTATATSIDGSILMAPDGRLLDVNPALERMTGYAMSELLQLTLADLMQSVPAEEVRDWISELMRRQSARFRSQWRRKDGGVIEVDISASHLPDSGGGQLFCFVRDVTEQIETTRRLARLNALYAFLNRASEALFTATSAQSAYEIVTQAALDEGRFRLCWIGAVDEAAGVVRPVAWAGSASEYVKQLNITTDPALPSSRGPAGVCVRDARVVLANDFAHDPSTAPWHALAKEHGLGSCATLPVIVDGKVVAIIVFYAAERGFFDIETLSTLGEVARLLGLVLQSVAAEQRRRIEEERRRASEERFRRLFESSPLPMYVMHEQSGLITRLNHAFTERFGYTIEDIPTVDAQMTKFYPDPAIRATLAAVWTDDVGRASSEEVPVQSPDLHICCKDGTFRDVQRFVSRAGDELVLGWVDVTEQRAVQATLQQAEEIAKLGSFAHDFLTDEVRTSPGFLRVLGFDPSVLQSSAGDAAPWLFNLFHPDDVDHMRAALGQRADVDRIVRAAPDGGPQRYLHVRVRIERDAADAPRRAVGSFQDVTAEVNATTELTRLRDHLQDLVEERTAELAKANAILQTTDRRLKAMLAMSQKAATLDEAAILQLGIDEATRLTGSGVGLLHLFAEDQEHIEFGTWATGTQEQCECLYESHYPVSSAGTWADAVRSGEPIVLNQLEAGGLPACPTGHVALRRLLAVPVRDGGRVVMLLGVGNKDTDYETSDVQELEIIGHDIWSVIQRRRGDLALERAYERVKASDQRFAFAMEASSEGVWEWDILHGRYSFNDPFATMLGYTPSELSRDVKDWLRLLHPEERDGVIATLVATIKADLPYSEEFRVRAKDGSYRWIYVRGRVVQRDAHGQALRAVGTLTDLTARRQAEDDLRQAKEAADAASRAKSAFLATMSHEIRTPLNGVIAMAEILGQSQLPPHDMDAVQTIQSSAHALMAVIDDILDFSKIEAGRLEIDLADVSLLQLAEDLTESLLPVARSRDVDLLLFVEPEVPLRVRGDPTRLRQIMYNLTGNAIKFSAGRPERHGQVSIRIGIASRDPSVFYCDVVDNGIGMTEETVSRLFSSFTQAEASTTRKFGGTGLGLAITKRLVELMNGEISVTSAPGAGSTFRVTIPLPVVESKPALVPHDLTGLNCIIVKHDGGIPARDLKRYLEFAGARVDVVADEPSAATLAGRLGSLCVILHDLNGQRVLDSIPDFADYHNVRHVALTRGRRRVERVKVPNVVMLDLELLRSRRLIRATAVAAGRASPEVYHGLETSELLTVPEDARKPERFSVEEARRAGRLILVAEDDHTNQKVILQQLQLLGHTAEIAENGAEALAMWRAGSRYALLLSDLHMPEMDGYALTQAIRAEEKAGERLPIVALTANALRGEAARATTVGMDGYLTKPVPLRTLRELVNRYISPDVRDAAARDDATETPAATPPAPVENSMAQQPQYTPGEVRRSALADLVGDDEAVIREFLADFQASARQLAEEIHVAHDAGNLSQVGALAHRLKSSARSVGALYFGELCAELEKAGKMGQAGLVNDAYQRFGTELALVDAALTKYLAGS